VAFEDLLTSKDDWFSKPGPYNEVVISSRIRLARNLQDKKFPHHASVAEQKEIVDAFEKALPALPGEDGLTFVRLNNVSSLDRQFLTEHQLISAEHAASLGERAVAFNAKEGVSFLVNEEDHLRLQMFKPGLDLKVIFQTLMKADAELEKKLAYAKDPQLGFLTACPTNLGVALRASVMVHLPALVYTNRIAQVLQGVTQVGLTVRGLQGETTQVASAFFQISNQSSLGKTGQEIVEHVDRVARQMVEVELQAQKTAFQQEGMKIQDRICRALGALKTARIMSLQEALDGLSAVRVGVEQKILEGVDLPSLNKVLILIQPAHLAKMAAREISDEETSMERAKLLSGILKRVEPV